MVRQPNGLLTKAEPDEELALEYDASSLESSAVEKECHYHTTGSYESVYWVDSGAYDNFWALEILLCEALLREDEMLNERISAGLAQPVQPAQPVRPVKMEDVGDQPGLNEEHYEVGFDAETGVSCMKSGKHILQKLNNISVLVF